MPITYNETDDIWELTNPTQQEKESLTKIAIQDIVDFFGQEVGHRIVQAAKHEIVNKDDMGEPTGAGAGTFQTGEVGNA